MVHQTCVAPTIGTDRQYLSKKMIHDRTRQSTEDILHRFWDEQVGKCQHCYGSMERVCAVLEDTNEQGLMIPGVPSNRMMPLCYFSNAHVWSHPTDAAVCWLLSGYNQQHQVIRRFALMLQFRHAFWETFPTMYSVLRLGNCEDTTTTLPDQPDGQTSAQFSRTHRRVRTQPPTQWPITRDDMRARQEVELENSKRRFCEVVEWRLIFELHQPEPPPAH